MRRSTRTTLLDLVLSRPAATLGAERVRDVPVIGDSWSKATFLRRLRHVTLSTGTRLERAQERYKRDFDKCVASDKRNLKADDQAFVDVRGTPAELTLLRRRPMKLDWKTVGPSTVLANDGSTIVRDVDGLPQSVNADRIRLAPSEMNDLPS